MYALDPDSGSLLWKFLAAPAERMVTVDGQLESAWPIYGLTIHKGALAFSAGRHGEVDNGIFLYGLSPKTGTLQWKTNLVTPSIKAEPLNSKVFNSDNARMTPMNGFVKSSNGQLLLKSLRWLKKVALKAKMVGIGLGMWSWNHVNFQLIQKQPMD